MKSALYAANTSSQSVLENGTVNFGSIVRRFGCHLGIAGGNAILSGAGYYDVDTNITFTTTGAATVSIAIYKDGVAVPGATSTVTTTVAEDVAVSIPCIIKHCCDCESTITVVISGSAATVSNAAISVEKV